MSIQRDQWINDQVERMRRDGVWTDAIEADLYVLRIGATTSTDSDRTVVEFWPTRKIEAVGIRAFGPVEITELAGLRFPNPRPLQSFSKAPYVEMEMGIIDPINGARMIFVATEEAREIDVFVIGQIVTERIDPSEIEQER